MTRCRLVAGSFGNLSQKNGVLAVSVAGVATVAGFFISIRKNTPYKEIYGKNQRNKFKRVATVVTVATALSGQRKICDRFALQLATNLSQPQAVPSCL